MLGWDVTVLVAVLVALTAVLWVTDVRFKDQSSATDCGVPVGAMWHGRPGLNASALAHLPTDAAHDGFIVIRQSRSTPSLFVTACRGEARTRVAIATVLIVAAIGVTVWMIRRGRTVPPLPA